ncbi:hypothetical protein [Haloterrigena salinisoli]|uniref:hypothetical protein n=1 Tax=Haloterrigena salinisoli TaxID=3132747 RepID=UPI0030CB0A2B
MEMISNEEDGEIIVNGAEPLALGISNSVGGEVDRQEHLRQLISQWLDVIGFRTNEDVQRWKNEGYRARDILNRLREEKRAGEPLENFDPWPPGRDPRKSSFPRV